MKKSIGKIITLVYIFSLFSSPVFADEVGGHDIDIQENPNTGGFTVCVDQTCTDLDDEGPDSIEPLLKMGVEIALIVTILLILHNQISNKAQNAFEKVGEEMENNINNPNNNPPETPPVVDPPVSPPTAPSTPEYPQIA